MSENKTKLSNEQLEQAVGGGGSAEKYKEMDILYSRDNSDLRIVILGSDGDGLYSVEIQTYSDGRWKIGSKTLLVEYILDTQYQKNRK